MQARRSSNLRLRGAKCLDRRCPDPIWYQIVPSYATPPAHIQIGASPFRIHVASVDRLCNRDAESSPDHAALDGWATARAGSQNSLAWAACTELLLTSSKPLYQRVNESLEAMARFRMT